MFFKYKLFSFPMENRVNRYSVYPVSFECIDENWFRFHQIGPMIRLKGRFSKNFFFWKKLIWWLGVVGHLRKPCRKAHPSTPIEKKHSLLTFKHFLFDFHDIFSPHFFSLVTPFGVKFHEKSIKKTCFLNKNCFHFLWKTGSKWRCWRHLQYRASDWYRLF